MDVYGSRKGIVPDDVIDVPELDDAPVYDWKIEVNEELTNEEINVIEQHGGARHQQLNKPGFLSPGWCYIPYPVVWVDTGGPTTLSWAEG